MKLSRLLPVAIYDAIERRRSWRAFARTVPTLPAPQGYGALLPASPEGRPTWLDPQEIVARHLPLGLSERKADYVTTWDHPFRLRADHPFYAEATQ